MASRVVSSAEIREIFRQKVANENKVGMGTLMFFHTILGVLITLHADNLYLFIYFVLTEIYTAGISLSPKKAPEIFEFVMPIHRLGFIFWATLISPNPVLGSLFLLEFLIGSALTNSKQMVLFWSSLAAFCTSLAFWLNPSTAKFSNEFILAYFALIATLSAFGYVVSSFITKSAVDYEQEKANLHEASARYDVLLNSVGDGMIIVGRSGIIEFVNRRALDILGFTREDLLSQPMSATVIMSNDKGEPLTQHEYPLTKVIHSGERIVINQASKDGIIITRKDHSDFPATLSIAPIKLMGITDGAVVLFTDSSELEEVEKAKSEFVSLASHQLRTPLNIVSWYTEKLLSQRKGELNEKQKGYVEEIRVSNRRMITLVGDLLNVSRIDLGKRQREHNEVNISELIQNLVREVKLMAERKSINFIVETPQELKILKDSDLNIVTIIIQNLLSNALKYTPEKGKVSITLSLVDAGQELSPSQSKRAEKQGVLITVKDTGVGIPDSQRDKIFSRLFRADNAKNMDVEGTGLGLYVTKSFCEMLGGEIWFDSVQGEGTTFYVYLPE